jgi:putative aminopeptidase FrvX
LGNALVAKMTATCCAVLIETLKQLQQTPPCGVLCLYRAEEVSARGATAAYKVHPDVSIAVDMTDSNIPNAKILVKWAWGPSR